jgi:hypothetical protein
MRKGVKLAFLNKLLKGRGVHSQIFDLLRNRRLKRSGLDKIEVMLKQFMKIN